MHLHREIDHNLRLVTYCLHTTEITNVQEWILVKLRTVRGTWNFLLDRYDLYQSRTLCENPNNAIFRSNIL